MTFISSVNAAIEIFFEDLLVSFVTNFDAGYCLLRSFVVRREFV